MPGLPGEPSSLNTEWWNRVVFYEVFVRSFYDARSGSKAGDGIGDFQGLIEKLDYLNDGNPNTSDDLGIGALWLMPVMQSPSYHGYDTTDYYQIERDYGDNALFQLFMAECRQRGIKVIIDLVLNHASSQHPFFVQSRNEGSSYRDWFVWSSNNPGFSGPWGQPVWHQSGNAWYYGLFWSGMPDWNYANPNVSQMAKDISAFWLDDMDVDGFRLDAIRYLFEDGNNVQDTTETHNWLTEYFADYKSVKSDAFTVGEVWADSSIVASYKGQMDTNFQFDLAGAMINAVNGGTVFTLEGQLQTTWDNFDSNQFATFLTNHDQPRVMTELAGSIPKAKLAATVLLTTPGVPFIYYGEEIGMQGTKPDELIRTPMQWTGGSHAGFSTRSPWQAPASGYQQVNVQAQQTDTDSLWHHYRKLIHLRNDNPALLEGNFTRIDTSESTVLCFLRQAPGQSALVLINMTPNSVDDYVVALDADYDNAVELLNGAALSKGSATTKNGLTGFKPIGELEARTGYIIRFP
ncbi:MAG: alpha-amylase family glycosyl hydrolase [Acidobacteriota bacterium]|nr:alpha-amylase family glycosyl hydrolase [Acidobacteriota bacterium]